jgi:hypothetical protein
MTYLIPVQDKPDPALLIDRNSKVLDDDLQERGQYIKVPCVETQVMTRWRAKVVNGQYVLYCLDTPA